MRSYQKNTFECDTILRAIICAQMKLAEAVQLGEKGADMSDAPRLLKKKGAGAKVGSPKEEKESGKGSAPKSRCRTVFWLE